MADTTSQVLNFEELADYLRVPKSTLYKLVREGKLPCQKVGRQYRFLKEAIDRWLEQSGGRERPEREV
jgi:excisionase family DNA binding protein